MKKYIFLFGLLGVGLLSLVSSKPASAAVSGVSFCMDMCDSVRGKLGKSVLTNGDAFIDLWETIASGKRGYNRTAVNNIFEKFSGMGFEEFKEEFKFGRTVTEGMPYGLTLSIEHSTETVNHSSMILPGSGSVYMFDLPRGNNVAVFRVTIVWTRIDENGDAITRTTVVVFSKECVNIVSVHTSSTTKGKPLPSPTPTPPPTKDDGSVTCASSSCNYTKPEIDCPCDNVDPPEPELPPSPPKVVRPRSESSLGSVRAVAENKTYPNGQVVTTNSTTDYPNSPEYDPYLTEEDLNTITGDETNRIYAKPHDQVKITVRAKAASISGHTKSPKATTSVEDKDFDNKFAEVTQKHVGTIHVGTAYANPLSASLFWTPQYRQYWYTRTWVPIPNSGEKECTKSVDSWRSGGTTSKCTGGYKDEVCQGWSTIENPPVSCGKVKCKTKCYFVKDWEPTPDFVWYISSWKDDYEESGGAKKTVEVAIPYNYIAAPYSDQKSKNTVLGGTDLQVVPKIKISPRSNPEVYPRAYATNTKKTTYETVTFLLTPNSSKPRGVGDTDATLSSSTYSSAPAVGDSCRHYTSGTSQYGSSRPCVVVQHGEGVYNGDNINLLLPGSTNADNYVATLDETLHLVVDDAPVGSKFCVATSIWPATSHDVLGGEYNATDKGGFISYGQPECYTITKKPSVQFQGSGIYSKGKIVTTQTIKRISEKYPTGFLATHNDTGLASNSKGNIVTTKDDDKRRVYGSWVEYEVVSHKDPVKNLASGAALGYELSNGGVAPSGARPGGFETTRSIDFQAQNVCSYTKSTIANSLCETKKTSGASNIDINDTATVQRILARYASKPDVGNDSIIYHEEAGNYTIDNVNVLIGKTHVFNIKGTATIAKNIAYPEVSYNDIASLPQVIIIADNIHISESVTRVDAWLIAGQNPYDNSNKTNGVVDTCPGYSVGGNLDASVCKERLTINGPIFAKKLDLKRTAGAEPGYSSIDPAEVINLRADTYLWAYNQSQRLSQAVVTYSRELAPRY